MKPRHIFREAAKFQHCLTAYYQEITKVEVQTDLSYPVTCNEVAFVTHEARLFAVKFTCLAVLLLAHAMPCGYLSHCASSSAFYCTAGNKLADMSLVIVVPQLSHFEHTYARLLHTALRPVMVYTGSNGICRLSSTWRAPSC